MNDLTQKANEEGDRLESISIEFKGLIENRDYNTARTFYNGLSEEESHPEYRWDMKKLELERESKKK